MLAAKLKALGFAQPVTTKDGCLKDPVLSVFWSLITELLRLFLMELVGSEVECCLMILARLMEDLVAAGLPLELSWLCPVKRMRALCKVRLFFEMLVLAGRMSTDVYRLDSFRGGIIYSLDALGLPGVQILSAIELQSESG